MGKRSVRLFLRKNRLLIAFILGIFIDLPQSIDAYISLSEHVSNGDIAMNLSWLYWITIPLGLGIFGFLIWTTRKPVLNEDEKAKVVALIEAVNALDDEMLRFFNRTIYSSGDRVKEYDELVDSGEFGKLWDSYSSLRANVSMVSPKLSEQTRRLISLLQHTYAYALKEWRVDELPSYKIFLDEVIVASENIRRQMNKTIENLIS